MLTEFWKVNHECIGNLVIKNQTLYNYDVNLVVNDCIPFSIP